MDKKKYILLTGATGYVGGRLLRRLSTRGYPVRCLARKPEYLRSRVPDGVEVVQGDVLDRETLTEAFRGISAAYYLVHSMGSTGDFEEMDRTGAANFASVARGCGVGRIVYLGGLGKGNDLSPHLRSRQEVGTVLRASGVPVIELRASVVIGSGSLSFEMIRALVERLPVMVTPRWVNVKSQPIAIDDLLAYLVDSLEVHLTGDGIIEVGGADQVSYRELMDEYARLRGLRRVMIPVPVLSPRLSSLWLGLVTPLYARTGRKLIDSLRHPTIVHDRSAAQLFRVAPRGVSQAIKDALMNEENEYAETRWSDSLSASGRGTGYGGVRMGNRLIDQRSVTVQLTPERVFRPIREIGGKKGWYFGNWLWRLRGFIDLLAGGIGVRRGRSHPLRIRVGDVIDWWRVEAFETDKHLRLTAEMKLPGRAWLEFTVSPQGSSSIVTQTAIFDPIGLPGIMYWYLVYPLHALVFRGMLAGIVREASMTATSTNGDHPCATN